MFIYSTYVTCRNRLKYALNMKEVQTIMKQRLIKIDGKVTLDYLIIIPGKIQNNI